jgi:hypothetical protein
MGKGMKGHRANPGPHLDVRAEPSARSHQPADGIEESSFSMTSEGGSQERETGALEIENLQEKFFANTLLTVASGKVSAGLDSFASWLFGGSAAALTFLLGNLDSLGKYLAVSALRDSAYILLAATVPVAAEKLISAIVAGAAEGDASAREIGEATAERGVELDLPLALREFEQAFYPPFRRYIKASIKKMEKGDLAASGRRLAKLTQIQVGLVITEVLLIIWTIATLVGGLTI